MKYKSTIIALVIFVVLVLTVAYDTSWLRAEGMFDGTSPPHAVDTSGRAIPDSSAVQPDKPIILSKDSKDPKWGELKPEATFDHTKHNTEVKHSLDGKTLTACVHCHHTEQPMPVASLPYLKKSERAEVLTANTLTAANAQAVNSCRHCHYQPSTPASGEYPPKSVKYPRGSALPESGLLTSDTAYHIRCVSCHETAKARDASLKSPTGCGDCHVRK
jgi:cytochrome c553